MTSKNLVRSALAVLTSAAVLAACGNGDADYDMGAVAPTEATAVPPGSGQATGEHNAADVAFAQQMIPHHRQAVEMAGLVDGRSDNPKILDLAARIEEAQDPEIATLTGWLRAWGEPVDAPGDGGHSMPGMDHGSGMPGMMTDADMAALRAATGEDFDQRWVSMMIVHHQGAVEMAEVELAEGANPDAKKLAQQIIDAQNAEIREMQALLPQG